MNKVCLQFNQTMGPLKNMQGVNCGPVSYSGLLDISDLFKAISVPLIRLHDTNWPHPREVDYYTIFPDFEKDPSDPENYHFETTDQYVKECIATGANIVFRLGVSIEHANQKFYVKPPKDFNKFADICLGIVRHYTEGWADGWNCKEISYWEIWNEPDLKVGFGRTHLPSPTWMGTPEEYFKLYEIVSKKLKKYNSSLQIGGPAIAYVDTEFFDDFLNYVEAHQLPMDFFSWLCYTSDVLKVRKQANKVRDRLDKMGYTHTESHLNEWSYVPPGTSFGKMFAPGMDGEYRTKMHQQLQGEQGAAYSAAFMTLLQKEPVDKTMFFCASTLNTLSLFNMYGQPQAVYYPFYYMAQLCKLGNLTDIQIPEEGKGLFYLSACNPATCNYGILVTNYGGRAETICFETDLPADISGTMTVYCTDKENVCSQASMHASKTIELQIKEFSVAYIEIVAEDLISHI